MRESGLPSKGSTTLSIIDTTSVVNIRQDIQAQIHSYGIDTLSSFSN